MSALVDSPRTDRPFAIALGVLLVIGAAELLVTAFHFSARARAQHAAAATPAPRIASAMSSATPVAAAPAAAVATPGEASTTTLSASDRLLKQATALRERGDMMNAIAKLQEASQRDPKNASVLAELASDYDSTQNLDRANDTWRKIIELGPDAGTFYELADRRLKTGAQQPPPRAPTDSAGTPLDADGIPAGSTFGVADVALEEVVDPDAETNLKLKIAVKKRPGVAIDMSKLKIIVRFYDLVGNDRFVDTDADVNYEWFNSKHDWSEANPETLIVSYLRLKTHAITSEAAISAAAAAVTPGKISTRKKKAEAASADDLPTDPGHRKYLGYIIRIFYDDKLQTVRAEPSDLLTRAPVPNTASP
ncbi:MAG: tetratricopeptide repeat protein [Verrucomicrobiota bacterium]|nr:tetratricopeptide repeat protein [Verrucomicrobiota bacterium]